MRSSGGDPVSAAGAGHASGWHVRPHLCERRERRAAQRHRQAAEADAEGLCQGAPDMAMERGEPFSLFGQHQRALSVPRQEKLFMVASTSMAACQNHEHSYRLYLTYSEANVLQLAAP